MILNKVNLKELYPTLINDVYLESYCPDNFMEFSNGKVRKCVLVLPGGGYSFLSEREAEPVALRFAANDIACFVLKYSLSNRIIYPHPMIEVFAALSYIRRNADLYHINVDKISVCGFSAGGHLAASSSAYHQTQEYADYLNIPMEEMKINGCILAYPVISAEYGHLETFKNVAKGDPKLLELYSIDKHISTDFPKTFIWHTTFDTVVDLKNSLLLADELCKNKVFFEMHVYPMHDHGQALCDETVYYNNLDKKFIDEIKYNTQWIDNAIHFIKEYI